jgi:hypothetical protein
MILQVDSTALVKRYVAEPGTAEVAEAIAGAEVVGTSLLSFVYSFPRSLSHPLLPATPETSAPTGHSLHGRPACNRAGSSVPQLAKVTGTSLASKRSDPRGKAA